MKPRERIFNSGPQSLSNAELIAVLLRTGRTEKDVLSLAEEILKIYPSLTLLSEATPGELLRIKGVGLAKASSLLAALELGKRLHKELQKNRNKLQTPEDIASMCSDMKFYRKEVLRIIGVDNGLKYISHKDFSSSLKNIVEISLKDIFSFLIRIMADGFFVVHNHTSIPKPSRDDIELTSKMKKAGDILGINLIDHVIIYPKGHISLKNKGLI